MGKLKQIFTVFALLALAACQTIAPPLPPAPVHAHGQVLWGIVHGQCVPDQQAHGTPAPCAEVNLTPPNEARGEGAGYAVLKDRDGASQYLVMPTRLISGIEDPAVLAAGATNYFAAAWPEQRLVDAKLGSTLPRQDVSVAVNSVYGRSQDLLHLHVDCVRTDVRDALRLTAPDIGTGWSRGVIMLAGHPYKVMRLEGADLTANPFRLLADGLHVPPGEMGGWTLVLVGAELGARGPGFYLLADRVNLTKGDYASGEELQDHGCAGRGAVH